MDDESRARAHHHIHIIHRVGNNLLTSEMPDEPLCLGDVFIYKSSKMFEDLGKWRRIFIEELSQYSKEAIVDAFDKQGEPISDEGKRWFASVRDRLRSKYDRMPLWYGAPFNLENELADFDYWSKAAFFDLDEALFLSVGLEPKPKFLEALQPDTSKRANADPIVEFMQARKELFRREFNPYRGNSTHKASSYLDWIKSVELQVHPAFLRMLEKMVQRTVAADPKPTAELTSGSLEVFDPREKLSLAKLILVIAIREYGYDPTSKKSPIPREIENIAAELGLTLSNETIRKYLQLGSSELPKGWKPN